MKDYYSILGVPIDADTSLIKSVYKSLCKIYHPDTYVGNKTYADKKIKEINEAYEHLKNPEKRKKYDTEFQNNYSENSENNSHNHKKNNENDFEKSIKPDWEILVNYFPEIELERLYLKKLDLNLSTNFQIILISLDNPENLDWKNWSKRLVDEFFQKNIKGDLRIHRFCETLLLSGKIDLFNKIKNELRVLRNMGNDIVLKKLEAKYSLELKNLETGNEKIRFLLKPWSNTFNHFGYTTVIEKNNVQYLKFIKSLLLTLITIACAFVSLIYINFYLVIIFLTISFVSFFIAIGNNYDAFGNKFEEISSKLIFIDLFFKSDSTSRVYLIIFGMFLTGLIFHGISNWFE